MIRRFAEWNRKPITVVDWLTIVFVSFSIGLTFVILVAIAEGS